MIATSEVLVAASAIQPGQKLNPMLVRWQRWPTSNIDASFITHRQQPSIELAVRNTVARTPIMAGEPLSGSKIVHSDSAGFMAATLGVGMRAVSIPITTESGAGGFILPNDRVDLMMSVQISDNPKRYQARIVLANIRVLAVDQTIKQDQNQKVVLAKTATLELTPAQARAVVRAQSTGMLSLAFLERQQCRGRGCAKSSRRRTGTVSASSGGGPARRQHHSHSLRCRRQRQRKEGLGHAQNYSGHCAFDAWLFRRHGGGRAGETTGRRVAHHHHLDACGRLCAARHAGREQGGDRSA
jgi:pilus assembly protein CpaB